MVLRLLVFACVLVGTGAASSDLVDTDLFVGGEGGYFCYRLPNLLNLGTPGHMLAIVQGHKYDCQDSGRMDILAKSTQNNGRTWSDAVLVYSESTPEKDDVTIGTPSAIFDRVTGKVHLFVARNFEHVLLLNSLDSGLSWAAPRDLTKTLVPTEWSDTKIYIGLPQGIQLKRRGDVHRLITCANHNTPDGTRSHTIYSDDHGETWQNGESVGPNHMGECSVAETAAGVFLYARVWWDDDSDNATHALAHSTDGGVTFGPGNVTAIPGSIVDCQGSMVVAGGDTFLVGAPYGYTHFPRQNYTVLMSKAVDGFPGEWTSLPGANPLFTGPAEYSTLALPDAEPDTVFVIYERGHQYDGEGALRLTQLRLTPPFPPAPSPPTTPAPGSYPDVDGMVGVNTTAEGGAGPPATASGGGDYAAAWDGDINTFYDYSQGDGGYTQAILSTPAVVGHIEFYPRSGFLDRPVGGNFVGITASGDQVTLANIVSRPQNRWNALSVNVSSMIRSVRYESPNGGYGNVAEIKVYTPSSVISM